MVTQTTRSDRYRRLILDAPYEVCIERARYVTEAWQAHEHAHPAIRAARAFEHTVRHMTVRILDCEGIAGNQTSKVVGTAIPVERGDINAVLELELDALLNREHRPWSIEPADRAELEIDILPWWRERTVRAARKRQWRSSGRHVRLSWSPRSMVGRWRGLDLGTAVDMARSPEVSPWGALRELRELTYNNPALVTNVFDVQGHLVLGNGNVLSGGFLAIRDRAVERRDQCAAEGDVEGEAFCEGVRISCEAIRHLAGRHASLARRLARSEADPGRRDELLAMAERCDRVPFHPPRDFREAVQAVWLTQVGAVVAYGMPGIFATGRLDQHLWPWYRRDVEQGRLGRDEALDLVAELLVKLSSNALLVPTAGKATGSELGADSMAVTVGGVGRDGQDATNDLSYLFLDAVAAVRGLGNSFSVRVGPDAPPQWLQRVAEVHRVTSGPALFNDEVVVEAMVDSGCSLEDARDYAIIGCVEPTPDGNTFGCTSGNDVSLVGALEMALGRGALRIVGRQVGPDTGDPRRFTDFEQVMAAYLEQVRHLVDLVAAGVRVKDRIYAEGFPTPYVSATLDGCIEVARDMTQGGARYDFGSISARGLGTAVDGLAAIQALVFEQRRATMGELIDALDRNWDGHEVMRQLALNRAPRYGCDDPVADAIAARVVRFFCDEVSGRRGWRGGSLRPGFFSYGMHVLEGSLLGATPDGRRAGEPLSNSISPTNGSERHGPTGVMNSVASLGCEQITNGCALNIKLLPSMLASPARREAFCGLVRGYFAQGGMEVQFNVVDDAVLRDAQAHPERYRDLVVRVSGYSAFFTDLGRAIQDEIISRTAFSGA